MVWTGMVDGHSLGPARAAQWPPVTPPPSPDSEKQDKLSASLWALVSLVLLSESPPAPAVEGEALLFLQAGQQRGQGRPFLSPARPCPALPSPRPDAP